MSLSPQFLDELKSRITLSSVIGRSLKLERAGREFKACCPFHQEKTPSFTVVDEKGFYHCHGCGAHGDAIRWLTDHRGLGFMDAVHELAISVGLEVPARSVDDARREAERDRADQVLDKAGDWYVEQLSAAPKVQEILAERGVSPASIAKFGLGFAPLRLSVATCGVPPAALAEAGLMFEAQEGRDAGLWRDRFRQRIMIPLHDARGRMIGFAGRATDGATEPKYTNSPDSAHFDKGRVLFNLHRASAAARVARRLLIVEGQLDVVALDQAGIGEAVAPMGTALTEHQLERAWRVIECPTLMFDGDDAGHRAALRACERALPSAGPGRSLRIAILPTGEDPDSLIRKAGDAVSGRAAIEAVVAAAVPMAAWLWGAELARADGATPEGRAALWARLAKLADGVRDTETRSHYLADWRSRFDAQFPPAPLGVSFGEMAPDGGVRDISDLPEVEAARLRSVSAAWLARTIAYASASAEAAGQWAWQLGRRTGAKMIPENDAARAMDELRAAMIGVDPAELNRSFDAGALRGFDPEPLLLDMRCAGFARTDMGNAERWNARFGQDYLYTTAKGWLGWDGRRYRVLNQEKDVLPAEVMASVFLTVRAMAGEARFVEDTGALPDEEADPLAIDTPPPLGAMDAWLRTGKKPQRLSAAIAAWALTSEAASRLGCIANLAKRWVTVELSTFDTDPMLLNCGNGTLRFYKPEGGQPARVELKPHDRADRLTKVTACDYVEGAEAPWFLKTVRWAQPNTGVRRYLRQWMGYNLTGEMGEQIFHIWYGPLAANGKSTVGNACRDAIGDYGDTTNVETFLDEGPKKRGDAATPDIVRLPGVRFLTAGEPPKGAKINEPLINSVTGGDALLARDNFRSFFRFLPIFKFTLWCNDLPAIPQGTAGIWRRVKVVPWEQHLEPHERDQHLPAKIAKEYSGVLSWMIGGLLDYLDHGFVEPESVQLASADYKQDSDPLSTFLRTCTVVDPEGRAQGSEVYATFCAWAKAAGEVEWKPKGFAQALKAKGMAHKHSNGTHWLGIRLIRSPGDFIDGEGKVRSLDAMGGGAADGGVRLGEIDDGPLPGWDDMPPP